MKFTKVASFVSLLVFLFSLTSMQALAAVETADFSDVDESYEYSESVDYLRESGVVQGYADGTFQPNRQITRAEFLKIVLESSGKMEGKDAADYDKDCFPDSKGHWAEFYICFAKEEGFINGYPDGYFKPENTINFAEASKIVVNILELTPEADSSNWYASYVKALQNNEAIPPSIDAFDKAISRGEMSEIVWRVKEEQDYIETISYAGIERAVLAKETGDKLVPFNSCVDLGSYLEDNGNEYFGDLGGGIGEKAMDYSVGAIPESAPAESAAEPSAPAEEFSSTNVQVAGVDEADIVKNDGKYIYVLKDDTVRVVAAYPPEDMQELDAVDFADEEFYPSDMYVDGDKLVVIGWGSDSLRPPVGPYSFYEPTTTVYIFDTTDHENIEMERKVVMEGSYNSSRKVGDTVYLVTDKYQYAPTPYIMPKQAEMVPLYADVKGAALTTVDDTAKVAAPAVGCGDILYWPGGDTTDYLIVSAIPVDDSSKAVEKEVILGSSGEIYSSRSNLYVAEYDYPNWWEEDYEEKTVIHKFALDPADISYEGKGEVPGSILDQFSMDEYRENFRITTTSGDVWDSENPSSNNLYILNEDMERIGEIENIAPGEKIYSTRFMGGRAYMVTFKKVDPFFVIDVSNPEDPEILGKLKIPGYSDYLHPLDENHIIGFGKDAIDASESEIADRNLDFAWYQGMKVAMFDVTDVENPTELHKIEIGDRGTESTLLYDHKALLFDAEKGLMAFPITVAELSEEVKNDPETPDYTYGDPVYQGAYIYDVSVEDGFEFKGRISHYAEGEVEEKAGSYWWGTSDILRVLYIDDYLYTVSSAKVKANRLDNLNDVSEIELAE